MTSKTKCVRSLFWLTSAYAIVAASSLQAQTVDLRVIMIDDDLFALIDNTTERHRAIDDMLSDIAAIETDAPANMGTIVLYKDGPGIDNVPNLDGGANFVASLSRHWVVSDMRDGHSDAGNAGIDVPDLRNELHDILRNNRMDRLPNGENRLIDLHVFGNDWFRTSGTASGSMLTHQYPGLCYEYEDQSTKNWPGNVTLAVEFRPPAGYPIPHAYAMHGMMTYLQGSSVVNGPVRMRGHEAKGPNCPMSDDIHQFSDPTATSQGALGCGMPQAVSADVLANLESRCETDQHPAIGTGLNELPVHLVARDTNIVISQYSFSISNGGLAGQITTGIGGPTLSPGTAVSAPSMGGQVSDATLALIPRAGCRLTPLVEAEFASNGSRVQVIASGAPCVPATINIGEVTVQ